ncbi:MAG: hypothetical protein WCD89_00530 [Anaerocolumna sp.]
MSRLKKQNFFYEWIEMKIKRLISIIMILLGCNKIRAAKLDAIFWSDSND